MSASGTQFFRGPKSPWTAPVPRDADIDPRSDAYVAMFEDLEPVVSVRRFTVPVFLADETTPRFTVRPTAEYAVPGYAMEQVPIPHRAQPDPEDDGHMAVLDQTSGCVYEFYRAQRTENGWTAEWVNATPADGDGIYPDGLSTRAAGFSNPIGLIWPDELRAGHIPYALVFAYPFTRADVTVGLATRTDGRSTDPAALPIGAHLRLDPSVDIDALGLSPSERTIARALQEYGMILADSSGGFTLYAAHPASFAADPYPSLFGDVAYAGIGAIPFDRMQVLSLGEPEERYTGPPIPNRCNAASVD
ncbi:hypothetical protein [Pseudonocardia nigra]|uniref:hypothetical protein n=1 Tax=Pseudonocardia nigra TaxID=1921578 RepID=UPI001C5D2044|nr:hypothetical protein [Pseudonocardia nigra]